MTENEEMTIIAWRKMTMKEANDEEGKYNEMMKAALIY